MKFGIKELKRSQARKLLLGWVIQYKLVQNFIDNNLHRQKATAEKNLVQVQAEFKAQVLQAAGDKIFYDTFKQADLRYLLRRLVTLASQRRVGGGNVSGGPEASAA